MEYFKLCLEVIIKEQKRFNFDDETLASFTSALTSTFSENFDVGYNRCAYMYRYATCNIFFVKDCIEKFLLECSYAKDLLSALKSMSRKNLCSLSCGPGLDYLAFAMALAESNESPLEFNNVRIISRYGAWRNTVNFVCDALQEMKLPNQPNFKNVDVIQGNVLELFTDKMTTALKDSNVILMTKTLNLTAVPVDSNEENFLLRKLEELISHLKYGATVFVLDTKPSVALILKALSKYSGTYLYLPGHLAYKIPVTIPDAFKEKFGVNPVMSARGTFFVWQNSCSFPLRKVSSMSVFEKMKLAMTKNKAETNDTSSECAASDQTRFSFSEPPSEENKVFGISESLRNFVLKNMPVNSSPEEAFSNDISNVSSNNSAFEAFKILPEESIWNSPSHNMTFPSEDHKHESPSKPSLYSEERNDSFNNPIAPMKNPKNRCTVSQMLFSTSNPEWLGNNSESLKNMNEVGFSPQLMTASKSDTIENSQISPAFMKRENNVSTENPITKESTPKQDLSHNSASMGPIKYSSDALKNIQSKVLSDLSPSFQSNFDARINVSSPSPKIWPESPKKEASMKKSEKTKFASNEIQKRAFLEAKYCQTDPVEVKPESSDDSIRLLTDRIKKLVISLEREVTEQNGFCKNCEQKSNTYRNHDMGMNSSNYIYNNDCVQSRSASFQSSNQSEMGNKVQMDGKDPHKGNCSYARGDCNQRCCMNPHCFRQHYSQCCYERYNPGCCQTHCRPSCMHNCINASSPNIVIPLQNINSDILSQIVTILQSRSESG